MMNMIDECEINNIVQNGCMPQRVTHCLPVLYSTTTLNPYSPLQESPTC